jgi:hypothetical protein
MNLKARQLVNAPKIFLKKFTSTGEAYLSYFVTSLTNLLNTAEHLSIVIVRFCKYADKNIWSWK